MDNEKLKPCPFCGGAGLVQIAPFARGLKKCPHCGGNGREANNPEKQDSSKLTYADVERSGKWK